MAKTVAEIDGDSSGLVSELGKAKTAMGDLATGGKKLTDQLREVADQADIAAGNLVNKIGGPAAISAIGGIGIAFTGAKAVVGAFLDSSEKLFRSYGQEGQKVWEGLETQMNGISGAFAKAALGGGDMNTQAERMSQLLGSVQSAADTAMTPLAGIADTFFDIAYWESEAAKQAKKFQDQIKQAQDAADAAAKAAEDRKAGRIAALKDSAAEAGLGDLVTIGNKLEKVQGIIGEQAKVRGEMFGQVAAGIMKTYANTAGMNAEQIELQGRRASEEVERARKVIIEGQGSINGYVQKYGLERQRNELAIHQKAIENLRDAAGAELEVRRQTQEELEKFGTKAAPVRPRGAASKGPEEDPKAKAEREAKEALALYEQNNKAEQQLELDKLKAELERIDAHNAEKAKKAQEFLDFTKQMELDHIAEIHARGELTAEEQDQLNAERLQAVQDRAGQEMGIYAQVAGKQLVLGKLSAKEAADMARQQLGNVIMGLGDKAMAEAGIMAAGLNPLAIPMAAAGVAAYAIGGALSADKKAAGSTPATEKAEAAAPSSNNYAFNLRVDSVFADGESVARQFAMMQESARQRGLLQQGAY